MAQIIRQKLFNQRYANCAKVALLNRDSYLLIFQCIQRLVNRHDMQPCQCGSF